MRNLRSIASSSKRRVVSPPVDEIQRQLEVPRQLNRRVERTASRRENKVPPASNAKANFPDDYDEEAKQIIEFVRTYTMRVVRSSSR